MSQTGKNNLQNIHTRELILDEAERLIANKGVYDLQLKDIAGPLGIQVPAIYKHYKNRDAVLVAVSKRFIALLSQQFQFHSGSDASEGLCHSIDAFVDFNIMHPAYVRLSLIDFATPGGGMDYVKTAAGGDFADNLNHGPLAPMHQRMQLMLDQGCQQGYFRPRQSLDFYRVFYSSLLLQLVFPDDRLLTTAPNRKTVDSIKHALRDLCLRYLSPDA